MRGTGHNIKALQRGRSPKNVTPGFVKTNELEYPKRDEDAERLKTERGVCHMGKGLRPNGETVHGEKKNPTQEKGCQWTYWSKERIVVGYPLVPKNQNL